MTTNILMEKPDRERNQITKSPLSFTERRKTKPLARTRRIRRPNGTKSWSEDGQYQPSTLPLLLDVPVRLNNSGLTEVVTENITETDGDQSNPRDSPKATNQQTGLNSPEIIIQTVYDEEVASAADDTHICPCCSPSGSDVEVTEVTDDNQNTKIISQGDKDMIAKAKHKRGFVLTELLETERKYVADITILAKEFMEEIAKVDLPDGLRGREKIVFGNIRAVLAFHRDKFLPAIEESFDNPQELGELFTKYEKQLRLYITYCENKPRSEYLVTEYHSTFQKLATRLNKKLQISDYLIKPVQRIMKYQLLLKDILKYTEKSREPTISLHKAMDVMHTVPKAANNMMQVGRLHGFEVKMAVHGTVLLQDTLPVAEFDINKPTIRKFKPRRVFLFEQIFVISDLCESSTKGHYYKHRSSIKLSDLRLVTKVFEEKNAFILSNVRDTDIDTYIRAPSEEVKEEWTSEIQRVIDTQKDFLEVLQDPMSQLRLSPPSMRSGRACRAATDREAHADSCVHKNKHVKQHRTIH